MEGMAGFELCAVNMFVRECCAQSCLTLCNPMDCSPHRLLCSWNFPSKHPGAGDHFLLKGFCREEFSMRNSAHGKGHEEGGSALRKGGIEPQETPCSQVSTPKTRVCLLYCFMLSPAPVTLQGADPHHLFRRRS